MEERLNGAFSLMLVLCCCSFGMGLPIHFFLGWGLAYIIYAECLYYHALKKFKRFKTV